MPPGIPGQFLCLKPNHLQPQRFQIIGACRITGDSAIIIMLTAINFNNQFCTGTVEVRHKGVDDPLLIDFGGICTQKKVSELALMGCHFPAKRLCLFKLCVVFWNWHGLSPLLRCQTCGSPLASPFGRGAPDGAERAFLPSQSASLTAPPEWEPRDGRN